MGFAATLLAAWVTAGTQSRSARDGRLLDAKVRIFGECTASLHEYQRATFNRVKARIQGQPEDGRELLRQEAYRANTRSRAAIGQVAIISGNERLQRQLEKARKGVGELNNATDEKDLRQRAKQVHDTLNEALDLARLDLMRRSRAAVWSRPANI